MLKLLLGILLLLNIATLVSGIFRGREIKRRSIVFEGTPVDKAEFDRFTAANRNELDHIYSKMGGAERGIRAEIKADTVRIEGKVNDVDRKVGRLEAATELQNQQLARIETSVRHR